MSFLPTNYNGHTFRSLMEARWAVFFDYFGFRWEYEPHGFGDPEGEKYLPDFYLSEFDVYVEVKYRNDTTTIALSKRFALSHRIDIVMCDGNPHNRPLLLLAGSDKKGHLGMDSKILWFYHQDEGLAYNAEKSSERPEYREACLKANATRFSVMEIKSMLGQARKKQAFKLQDEMFGLAKKYGINRQELEHLTKTICEFNESACSRAFHEFFKNKVDELKLEPDDNFAYSKGLNDINWNGLDWI